MLRGGEEGGCFGPVDYDEFEGDGDEDCEKTFDYEDPAPACAHLSATMVPTSGSERQAMKKILPLYPPIPFM